MQSIHVHLLIQLFLHLQIILSCIWEPFFHLGTLIQSKQFCSHITEGFDILLLFIFLAADDKTPKSCRSTLAQLSLNSMKSAGVCIGRPVLLTSPTGQQEVCFHDLWSVQMSRILMLCICTSSFCCLSDFLTRVTVLQVCLGWPVAAFPGGKVGLQKCAQSNLRVKSGDKVSVHPLTGPVLRAEQVVLSSR